MYIKGLCLDPTDDTAYMTVHHENLVFDCVFDYHVSVASGYGDEDLPEYQVKGEPFIEGINFNLYSTRNGIHRIDCDFDLAIEYPHDIFKYSQQIAQDIVDSWLNLQNKNDDEGIEEKPYYENPWYDLKLDELLGK